MALLKQNMTHAEAAAHLREEVVGTLQLEPARQLAGPIELNVKFTSRHHRGLGAACGRSTARMVAGALWAVGRPRPPLDVELRHARLERRWFEPQDASCTLRTADAPSDPLEHGADVCALHVRESLVEGRG